MPLCLARTTYETLAWRQVTKQHLQKGGVNASAGNLVF